PTSERRGPNLARSRQTERTTVSDSAATRNVSPCRQSSRLVRNDAEVAPIAPARPLCIRDAPQRVAEALNSPQTCETGNALGKITEAGVTQPRKHAAYGPFDFAELNGWPSHKLPFGIRQGPPGQNFLWSCT